MSSEKSHVVNGEARRDGEGRGGAMWHGLVREGLSEKGVLISRLNTEKVPAMWVPGAERSRTRKPRSVQWAGARARPSRRMEHSGNEASGVRMT